MAGIPTRIAIQVRARRGLDRKDNQTQDRDAEQAEERPPGVASFHERIKQDARELSAKKHRARFPPHK